MRPDGMLVRFGEPDNKRGKVRGGESDAVPYDTPADRRTSRKTGSARDARIPASVKSNAVHRERARSRVRYKRARDTFPPARQ